MYQLHLGLGEDLERDLRAFAAANGGLSVAAAVRILLTQALKENRNAHASDR